MCANPLLGPTITQIAATWPLPSSEGCRPLHLCRWMRMSWVHRGNKRGDPCVGDPRGTRGDEPRSVHLPHLLPLPPTHVNRASGHASTTYLPHKTCHSTTTPRLTQLQLPWRCLTPICSRAPCMPVRALAAAEVRLA